MFAYDYAPPSKQEAEAARTATAQIVPFVRKPHTFSLFVTSESREEQIVLPSIAIPLIQRILEELAAGHGVTIIPQHAELSTLEAADILNVSRPYLIKLLESGEIPFRKVGRHRRILIEDLLTYREASEKRSRAAMEELVALSEELGLYDL